MEKKQCSPLTIDYDKEFVLPFDPVTKGLQPLQKH